MPGDEMHGFFRALLIWLALSALSLTLVAAVVMFVTALTERVDRRRALQGDETAPTDQPKH